MQGLGSITFGVAVVDLVRPVAAIRVGIEGQPFGAIENVTPSLDAVHEFAAVLSVSHLEVAVLVRTVLSRLSWL